MNGLKYIRTRCNLSLNELADIMGISRQALSSWETGKKEIPTKRLEQLEVIFGLDKKYFAEINEEDKQQLLMKAMFLYEENGKQSYRYAPPENLEELTVLPIYFLKDAEYSLDERYAQVLKRKKDTLDKVEDIINWTNNAGSLQSHLACINRGCEAYELITDMMQKMRTEKVNLKMDFYYEMLSIWYAMAIAYGIRDESKILSQFENCDFNVSEDPEWIKELAQYFKKHWEEKYTNKTLQCYNKKKVSLDDKADDLPTKNIKELIIDTEKQYLEDRKAHSDIEEMVYFVKI